MTWEDLCSWHFDFRTIYDEAVSRIDRRGALFVEIGCWVGKSVIYLASKIRDLNKNAIVWAVDNWKGASCDGLDKTCLEKAAAGLPLYDEFIGNVDKCGVKNIIKSFRPGEVPDPVSSEAAKQFADQSCDLIFIDADHSYEAVKRDVLAWYPKLKPEGILAGHDSNRDEVQNGVKDALAQLNAPGKMTVPVYAGWSWIYEV